MMRVRRSAAMRAFTLVELMVSLVAGVIIAIAVVGLAKAATTSFYEQARISSVEQTVRTAANRLRYDLTKVSFMGTGNIHLATYEPQPSDPQDFFVPYGHKVASHFSVIGAGGQRYPGKTTDLQGIRIAVNGSVAREASLGTFSPAPNFTSPDEITIGGNMTTDDWYIGRWDNTAGGACGGGKFIMRAAADPATERLINGSAQNVVNAFTPGADQTKRFLARVVDSLGCQHFVEVMGATATGVDPNNPTAAIATVDLCASPSDSVSLLEPGVARPGCGATPNTEETLRISPYHRVRWRISKNTIAALEPPTTVAPVDTTYMLIREMLDSSGTIVSDLTQIVAEYAVDLKFGIAVDRRESSPAPNNIAVFDMDSDPGGGNIDLWTRAASATTFTTGNPTVPGPQRVRSVRFRVSTRASMPDRNAALTLIPNSPYISRFCVDMPTCTKFARVRTIVSEVPLINQARMTY